MKTFRNSLLDGDFLLLDFLLLLLLRLLLGLGILLLLARVGFALLGVLGFRLKEINLQI